MVLIGFNGFPRVFIVIWFFVLLAQPGESIFVRLIPVLLRRTGSCGACGALAFTDGTHIAKHRYCLEAFPALPFAVGWSVLTI